jgi:hypothetical protein
MFLKKLKKLEKREFYGVFLVRSYAVEIKRLGIDDR